MSILFALLLTACSVLPLSGQGDQDVIVGSGKSVTETRRVGEFSSISVNGSASLFVQQGDSPSLTITADDNILPLLNPGSKVTS